MGLDTVALLLEVEDKFQIQFSDCEAEKTNTVGDFHNAILTKIELKLNASIVNDLGIN